MEILHESMNPTYGNEKATTMTWVRWFHCPYWMVHEEERD